jgi:FMN phosphatase YigB (HAD superfamily)
VTAVTDPTMQPETFVRPWQAALRGAKIIDKPLDIMFDYDDVVFPTMYSIHDLAREAGLHNGDVDPQWKGWTVYRLPDGTPCPPEVYWDLWSDFALAGGYTDTPPIPEAAEAMRELYFAGHRIHIVTARGFMAHAQDIRRWTLEHIEDFGIPWHTLTFAQDKVAGMIDALGGWEPPDARPSFDYAIDDSPKNVFNLRNAGIKAYLLDHAHNLNHEGDMPRVSSVPEFAKIIQEATQ